MSHSENCTCLICHNQKILSGTSNSSPIKRSTSKTGKYVTFGKVAKKGLKHVKWKDKSTKDLIRYVQDKLCNPYIRARDKALYGKCISCNSLITEAGHRFPTSTHGNMRFWVSNISGQETSCNRFKSGNLDEYDKGLINRHGQKYLDKLKKDAAICRASGVKWDKFNLIMIGETFKYLLENKIWIFNQKEFDEIKLKIAKL